MPVTTSAGCRSSTSGTGSVMPPSCPGRSEVGRQLLQPVAGVTVGRGVDGEPEAGADGVHLTPKGYKDLGDQLAVDVLAGYRP